MYISSSLPILLLSTLLPSPSYAWGSLGHRTVAYVASFHLTPVAQDWVKDLLNGQDISEAALFPDKIRYIPEFAYTRGWHYIDARDDPPRSCGINITRDCLDADGGCIVSAIKNHTERLLSTPVKPNKQHRSLLDQQQDLRQSTSQGSARGDEEDGLPHWQLGQSLRFILHFIGDVHQPLHTESELRGGNDIPVVFDGKKSNLHSVWDTMIPHKWAGSNFVDEQVSAMSWASRLYRADTRSTHAVEEETKNGKAEECINVSSPVSCALSWASEANSYVCSYVLRDDVAGLPVDLGRDPYPVVSTTTAVTTTSAGATGTSAVLSDSNNGVGKEETESYFTGAVPIVEEMITKAGRRLGAWLNEIAEQVVVDVVDANSEL